MKNNLELEPFFGRYHLSLNLVLIRITIAWVAFCGIPHQAIAQQAVTSATLTGSIEDSSGGRIVGATVKATNTDKNQTWNTTTDTQGRFRFLYLPVGAYDLSAQQEGFASAAQRLTLSVGQTLDLPIRLDVAGSRETVIVTGEAPAVETARTQLTQTIAPREIQDLPLNGRNYMDLALLSPNVSRQYATSLDKFAETSAVPGTGISVAGKRNLNSGFVVDGLSANDDAADLAGTFYSQEVIREFQVVTSGGIAEFGRTSSGTVNILTESGTNAWRGRAYGFFRNQRFDGTNAKATANPATGQKTKDLLTQTQYGVTLGGPLRRDKTFLFTNFEQERLHKTGFITILPADAATINAELNRIGFTSSRVETGEYPTGDNRSNYFAKMDHNLSDRNRLSLRYNFYDIFSPNARNVGGLNAISRGTITSDRDNTIGVSNITTLSANSVNEVRFQYVRSYLDAHGNDLIGPAVSISGVANFGSSTSSPINRNINLFELADNYSTQKGSHFLKVGVDWLSNRVDIVFPATYYGTYSFSNMANFLSGSYTTFGQAFGKIDWFQTNPNLGWFVQDEWKPRQNLTINVGLRHDVSWIADPVKTNWGNFSPRLGIAYSPGDRKTVIRAGFGLYYDRIPLRAVANGLRGDGTQYFSVSVNRGQVGSPAWPAKIPSVPPGVLLSLSPIDPNVKNEAGIQANLQIEREVLRGTAVSLGYQYLRGTHIIMSRNLNVPSCTSAVDPINLCRPNNSYANIGQYSGQGDSFYNGMSLSIRNQAKRWAALRFSYTWSKSIDNAYNAFFNSALDSFNLRADRSLADNDQRHRFTLSGTLQAPQYHSDNAFRKVLSGFQMSSIFTYSSPYPFNAVAGTNTIQNVGARPCYVLYVNGFCPAGSMAGRNVGVGFSFATLDSRISRTIALTERFKLEAMVEGFNLLNHTNRLAPNTTFGAPSTNATTGVVTGLYPSSPANPLTYGVETLAFDPRQIQFGLRLNF